MKLHEVTSVVETMTENKVEPVAKLLESKLAEFPIKPMEIQNVVVTQHYNINGNYTIIARVLLEHTGVLLTEERDDLLNRFVNYFEASFNNLAQSVSKGTLRTTTSKLI